MKSTEQKSQSLIDLTALHNVVISSIEANGGEITPELEVFLDQSAKEIATKIDSFQYAIKASESMESLWRDRAEAMAKVARSYAKIIERLKTIVKESIRAMDSFEIDGNDFRAALVPLKPRLVIVDEKKIPDAYLVQTIVTTPDKTAIQSAIENGENIPGAKLEPVTALRFYPARKKS